MTEVKATEKLRAYYKCQRLQVKGIYEDCNESLCDMKVLADKQKYCDDCSQS